MSIGGSLTRRNGFLAAAGIVIVAGGAMFLIAPGGGTTCPEMQNVAIHDHPNGLRLTALPGWIVTPTPKGFVVTHEEHTQRRDGAGQVSLQILLSPPRDLATRREVSGRSLSWSLSRNETGGSGGAEIALVATEPVSGGSLVYNALWQAEDAQPQDFLWQVAACTLPPRPLL